MLRTLAHALRPRPDWQPVACVLERSDQDFRQAVHQEVHQKVQPIVGFAFGAVTTPKRAVERLHKKLREYSAELAACGIDLDQIDLRAVLLSQSPVFYMDELCIEFGARNGMESLRGLAAVLFAGAAELGARGLLGFTSKRAAPFHLIVPGGGEIALDLGELVVFRMEDFLPIATLLHYLPADALIGLLAKAPT